MKNTFYCCTTPSHPGCTQSRAARLSNSSLAGSHTFSSVGDCALTINDLWVAGILQMFLDNRGLRDPASLLLSIEGALCVSAAFIIVLAVC